MIATLNDTIKVLCGGIITLKNRINCLKIRAIAAQMNFAFRSISMKVSYKTEKAGGESKGGKNDIVNF